MSPSPRRGSSSLSWAWGLAWPEGHQEGRGGPAGLEQALLHQEYVSFVIHSDVMPCVQGKGTRQACFLMATTHFKSCGRLDPHICMNISVSLWNVPAPIYATQCVLLSHHSHGFNPTSCQSTYIYIIIYIYQYIYQSSSSLIILPKGGTG